MKHKLAVIGLGNTFRRDDAVGIKVLESLLQFFPHPELTYLNFGTASFGLIHRIRDYDKVLLIDGIDGSLEPGGLKIFKLEEASYVVKSSSSSTHEFGLTSLFELYKTLKLKTEVYVAGIQVKDVSYGEGLSEELDKSKERIVREINSFINKLTVVGTARCAVPTLRRKNKNVLRDTRKS